MINREDFELLKIAVSLLRRERISENLWAWGGGTALKFFFHHRDSKDIDVFLKDPQIISYLTPRLNDFAEEVCQGNYIESSNFLKLKVGEREIDYIVTLNLTGILPRQVEIELAGVGSLKIPVEHPVEILARKFFYRAESLLLRDLVDYVVVKEKIKEKDLWNRFFAVVESKREVLIDRVDFLRKNFAEEIRKIAILDKRVFAYFEKRVEEFLKILFAFCPQEKGKKKRSGNFSLSFFLKLKS